MLDTLYKFGQQLSQNADREEFDDIISPPLIDEKEKEKVKFYVANIIFDLDLGAFQVDKAPKEFSEIDKAWSFSPYNLRCIKIQGGNNKSIYPTVDPRRSFEPWKKTFFGKEDKNGNPPKQAELVEAIDKDFPELTNSMLYKATVRIFQMRNVFEEKFPDWKKVSEALKMDEKNRVAMLFASVVSTELGILKPTPVAHLDGYDAFLQRKFILKGEVPDSDSADNIKVSKLCYVTGEFHDDVGEPVFDNRYSLNKMFVTTTKNYASEFDEKDFAKNYQASREAQVYLERGSAHFLKHYKVSIAGVDHCIVPRFRADQNIDLDVLTSRLKKKSELLFSMVRKDIKGLLSDFDDIADGSIYWVNFLGFESDGNFFKSINRIEDVSQTHFEKVMTVLDKVEAEMLEMEGAQWEKVMTYGKDQQYFNFNFYTIYNLIPVRDCKRNEALLLFKAILERRKIDLSLLFKHFTELIKCHWFQRKSAENVKPSDKKDFDFATRNAVFQYHAFILFLKKLKLLDMDDTTLISAATLDEKNIAISTFFERMGYEDDHRAMFYLGKILSNVGYAQFQKGHKTKPVLGKVNYNGMDAASVKRLYADLFEKCRQYDILRFNEGLFSKFTDLFKNEKNDPWDKRMRPEETLFYLLSGYSFRTQKEEVDDSEVSDATI